MNSKREVKDYFNGNAIDFITVIEALEGENFEPVSIRRIVHRTGLSYDKTRRLLLTAGQRGWATQNQRGEWALGTNFLRLSDRFARHCLAIVNSRI